MLQTKEEIKEWLEYYFIKDYIIHDDLTIDVNGNVGLGDRGIYQLPVQFGVVDGNFLISHSRISTLKGCPLKVTKKFDCSKNFLESLEFCPKEIGQAFICDYNQIRKLDYSPEIVGGSFYCMDNPIENLHGFKTKIERNFIHACQEKKSCITEIKDFYMFFEDHYHKYLFEFPSKKLNAILLQQELQKNLGNNIMKTHKVKI